MKKNSFIKIIAALCALVMIFTFVGCRKSADTQENVQSEDAALIVNGTAVSVAEAECAFHDIKAQLMRLSSQYQQSAGYSFYNKNTKSTDPCVYDDSMSWGEYIEKQAIERVKQVYLFKDEAGNDLSEEQKSKIEQTFTQLEQKAQEDGATLEQTIQKQYGDAVSESILRQWFEDAYRAESAQTNMQKEYADSLTDSDIQKYYDSHKQNYVSASAMAYTIAVDTTDIADKLADEKLSNKDKDGLIATACEQAKVSAEALFKQIKMNPEKFTELVNAYEKKAHGKSAVEYTDDTLTLSGTVNERMSILGETARATVAAADTKNAVYLDYSADYQSNAYQFDITRILEPAQTIQTVAVRHILVQPNSTQDDAAWDKAKAEIDSVYEEYKKDPSEENFSKLAKKYTSDPGSKDTGGLYESIMPGQMVQTFNDWCFDTTRKAGDTGIVKTEYGYHLMYFVRNGGEFWKTQVPKDMAKDFLDEKIQSRIDEATVEKGKAWEQVQDVAEYQKAAASKESTSTTQ
ncbi:MAG: peptidylprolyl isomerase [Clostridia bacterium]|nr:peptidylprolyl isomerase [Clostridia bacterium]